MKNDIKCYRETKEGENELDPTADSFGPISTADIKKCVSRGVIPKEIADELFKKMEINLAISDALMKKRKKKGKELTDEEILAIHNKLDPLFSKDAPKPTNLDTSNQIVSFILENKDKILSIISEPESGSFRIARDIIDNKFQKKTSSQPDLYKEALDRAKESPADIRLPYLKLSAAEDRALFVLCRLLADNSEKLNQTSSEYYMGNSGKGLVTLGDIELETARFTISPHEFYHTYLGRDNYGANDSRHIWETLISLAKKQFMVSVSCITPPKKKNKRKGVTVLRTLSPLFNLVIVNQDLSEQEAIELQDAPENLEGRSCRLLFKFNPIFTSAIRERYVEVPTDLHLRLAQTPSAGKKGRVPECVNLLINLLIREKQFKRYRVVRDESTLVSALGLEKELKGGRKKRVQDRIDQAINVSTELDLVISHEIGIGARGQKQYIFHLNKNFK